MLWKDSAWMDDQLADGQLHEYYNLTDGLFMMHDKKQGSQSS